MRVQNTGRSPENLNLGIFQLLAVVALPPCATQQSYAAAQPPKQPRNPPKPAEVPQEKPSSNRSRQPAPSTVYIPSPPPYQVYRKFPQPRIAKSREYAGFWGLWLAAVA